MPASASLPKVQATRAYGAEVILGGVTVDDCIEAAAAMCGAEGAVFVPPFDHRAILAGQATAGLEILADVPDASTVLVAIGGGGLCSGVAAAVKLTRPDVTVVGVMARGAASMGLSLAAGEPREVSPFTIADGIALRAPSQLTLDHIEAFVDEVVAVGDEEITQAMLLLLERTKAVVEPAGAAPLAALLSGQIGGDGPAVALLGGGNIDALLLGKLLDHGLGAGRHPRSPRGAVGAAARSCRHGAQRARCRAPSIGDEPADLDRGGARRRGDTRPRAPRLGAGGVARPGLRRAVGRVSRTA